MYSNVKFTDMKSISEEKKTNNKDEFKHYLAMY